MYTYTYLYCACNIHALYIYIYIYICIVYTRYAYTLVYLIRHSYLYELLAPSQWPYLHIWIDGSVFAKTSGGAIAMI